jgi:O-antigen/teichoic acid export membrane protein
MTSMEMPERFGRNTASSFALSIVTIVVALVATPVLTQHLGHEEYGIWVLVASIVGYLELLELGLAGTTVTFIGRQHAAGDEKALEQTVNTSFFTLAVLGLAALVVAVVVAIVLPSLVHVSPGLVTTTRALVIVLGIDIAASIPMDTFGGGLVALHRFELLNATLITVVVARAIAWILVLTTGGGLLELGIVTVALGLVGQAARFVLFKRLVPGLSVHPRHVDRDVLRMMARPASWFALGGFVENFRDYARILILGIVRNIATAGVFAVGETLSLLGSKVQGPATQQFFPHAARLTGLNDREGLRVAVTTGCRIATGTTIPFCLVVAVLARPAIITWVGPSYAAAAPAATLLACAFALDSIAAIPRQMLSGTGEQRIPALISVGAGAVEISLVAVLGYFYGITGVGVATLITVVAVELGTVPFLCGRLGVPSRGVFASVIRSHLIPVLVAGALGVYLSTGPVSHYVHVHGRLAGLVAVVVAGALVLVVYVALFAVTGLDGDERSRFLHFLRRRPST